eukprot:2301892-Rhodomonas_salina.2
MQLLADYKVSSIVHVPGKENVVADAMSRRPDYAQVSLLFSITELYSFDSPGTTVPVSDTFKELVAAQRDDPFCSKLAQNLKGDALPANDPIRERYHLVDNVLMWANKGRF